MAKGRTRNRAHERWTDHQVTLPDGRVLSWTWHPDPPYPQIDVPRIDGVRLCRDFDGVSAGDQAAALLREVGHEHGTLHTPFRGRTFMDDIYDHFNGIPPRGSDA